MPRNVGIMLFEEIEVLDFAVTAELNDPVPFNVYKIADSENMR